MMISFSPRLFFFALPMMLATRMMGQAGSLDSGFGSNGLVRTDVEMRNDKAFAVAMAPDGKIVTAGSTNDAGGSDILLVRYNSDGSTDAGFGANGVVRTSFGPYNSGAAHAVAVLADGKILVTGTRAVQVNASDMVTLRYKQDGEIDSTFGINGMAITSFGVTNDIANAIAVQPDGKIIVAGGALIGFALARYMPDGSPDGTFDGDGKLTTTLGGNGSAVNAIALAPDGRITVTGYANTSGRDLALARYSPDGQLDTTFGHTGFVTTSLGAGDDEGTSIALQPDGRVLAGGYADIFLDQFALLRYTTDGALDTSFAHTGKVITPVGPDNSDARALLLFPDSTILLAGSFHNFLNEDFALVKFNADGSRHTGFGTNGIVLTTFDDRDDFANTAVQQPDGKIVVAGYSMDSMRDVAVARYMNSPDVGIIDLAAFTNNVLIYPDPIEQHATLSYDLVQGGTLAINLLDAQGKWIMAILNSTAMTPGHHALDIDFPPSLAAGTYCVVLSSPTGRTTVRVVKTTP